MLNALGHGNFIDKSKEVFLYKVIVLVLFISLSASADEEQLALIDMHVYCGAFATAATHNPKANKEAWSKTAIKHLRSANKLGASEEYKKKIFDNLMSGLMSEAKIKGITDEEAPEMIQMLYFKYKCLSFK